MKCDTCNATLEIGMWPYCPHGKPEKSKGFEPYFDHGLGQYVTGVGDINKACRPRWENGQYIHVQPSDKGESYYRQLNEKRRERAEAERRRS